MSFRTRDFKSPASAISPPARDGNDSTSASQTRQVPPSSYKGFLQELGETGALAFEILVEPACNTIEPVNPVLGLTTARKLVALARIAHKLHSALEPPQRGEQLLRIAGRRAKVIVAVQDEQRRTNVIHIRQRRMLPETFRLSPRKAVELSLDPFGVVGRAMQVRHIVYTTLAHGTRESLVVTDEPHGHEPTV